MSCLVTLILHVLILLSADLLVLIYIFTVIMTNFFGLLFILCFAIAAIVTFTALRQWLVPAVADEPTAHVVPFYVHCVNCFM